MQNLNVVALTGNLTRDPELRHTPSGTSVCKLGLAVNDRTKKNDEWVDVAYFFDVTVWGKMGENCAQYLSKGRPVAIQGKLIWSSWEKDGQKRSKVEIVAQSVQFLNKKGDSGDNYGGADYSQGSGDSGGDMGTPTGDSMGTPATTEDFVPTGVDDDIPF